MNVLIVNGSPRRNGNTAKILDSAAQGTKIKADNIELINLYDYNYKGCVSCFACKLKNSKTNGLCAYKDEISIVLEKAQKADVIILGTPVYFTYPTGLMRAFIERLIFPLITYMVDQETKLPSRVLKKTVPVGIIYTMNVSENMMDEYNYRSVLQVNEFALQRAFGYCESLYVCDTYQFNDYSKYAVDYFDVNKKVVVKEKQFPVDLRNAYALGERLANLNI